MPKFLGMEPKTYLWVGGGLVALIVVYYVIKSRSGGAGVSAGGESFGGGGGIGGSSPVSYAPGAPDTSGDRYQQQLNDLDVQTQQEQLAEMKAMFGLQQDQAKQQIDFFGKQNSLALEGAAREQQNYLDVQTAQAGLATAQIGQTTSEVTSGKIKGECGKGESSAYDRNTGQFFCKKSGKSGVKTAADEIGQAGLDVATSYIKTNGKSYIDALLGKQVAKVTGGGNTGQSSGNTGGQTQNSYGWQKPADPYGSFVIPSGNSNASNGSPYSQQAKRNNVQ